jgi:cell division septal protein FtsQ
MNIGTRDEGVRRSNRGRQLLNVRIRATTARRKRQEIAAKLSLLGIVVALLCGVAWYGTNKALDKFFYCNPAYNLRELNLELDDVITGEDLVARTGIEIGENIFGIDLAATEKSLRSIPMVKDVFTERILPSTVKITLTSRVPVAWVSPATDPSTPYDPANMELVDASGFLMKPLLVTTSQHQLPVIYGVNSSEIGDRESLHNDDLKKALTLLSIARTSVDSLLVIRSLNISKGYCIDAITDQNAHIKFASDDFATQLEKLRRLLEHCRETGRQLESVNLMAKKNTPVKFVMAALTPPPKRQQISEKPKSTQQKTRGKKN